MRSNDDVKGAARVALMVVLVTTSIAFAQNAQPDLSGQYDGFTQDTRSVRPCSVGNETADCSEVPYTAAGQAAARAFDRAAYQEVYASTCTIARMPQVTSPGRYLLRIQQDDNLISFVYQRTDTIRTVRISSEPVPADFPQTRLGYSVGRWEDGVLIVETTRLTGGNVGNSGWPYGEQALVIERYWKEPGDDALEMEVTLQDPVNYTRPFVLFRYRFESQPDWDWTPWNCSIL